MVVVGGGVGVCDAATEAFAGDFDESKRQVPSGSLTWNWRMGPGRAFSCCRQIVKLVSRIESETRFCHLPMLEPSPLSLKVA